MSSAPSSSDGPQIEATAGGSLLPVRVRPGGRCERVYGLHAGAVKIEVTAPPEKGNANRALLKFLAGCLHVPKSALAIRTGEHAQTKLILIPLEPSTLRARLAPFLKGAP